METTKITKNSTYETIIELFYEDGYDVQNLYQAFDTNDFGPFPRLSILAHKVRKNAETGSLVWTEKHIIGTRSGYAFKVMR